MHDESSLDCPHCVAVAKPGGYRDVAAPADEPVRMHRFAHPAGLSVDQCRRCGGVFLPEASWARIRGYLSSGRLPEAGRFAEALHGLRGAMVRETVATVCPECDVEMRLEQVSILGWEVVQRDVCPTCRGSWLDLGELDALEELWELT